MFMISDQHHVLKMEQKLDALHIYNKLRLTELQIAYQKLPIRRFPDLNINYPGMGSSMNSGTSLLKNVC